MVTSLNQWLVRDAALVNDECRMTNDE